MSIAPRPPERLPRALRSPTMLATQNEEQKKKRADQSTR
jgi:hypothetical protein